MQVLGACVHKFLLFWSTMALVAYIVKGPGYMTLLWFLEQSSLRWSCFSSNIEGLGYCDSRRKFTATMPLPVYVNV